MKFSVEFELKFLQPKVFVFLPTNRWPKTRIDSYKWPEKKSQFERAHLYSCHVNAMHWMHRRCEPCQWMHLPIQQRTNPADTRVRINCRERIHCNLTWPNALPGKSQARVALSPNENFYLPISFKLCVMFYACLGRRCHWTVPHDAKRFCHCMSCACVSGRHSLRQ